MFLDYVLTIQLSDGSIDVAVDDRMYLVSENVLINESTLRNSGCLLAGFYYIIRHPQESVVCQSSNDATTWLFGVAALFGTALALASWRIGQIALDSGLRYLLIGYFCLPSGRPVGSGTAGRECVFGSTLVVSNGLVLFGVASILTAQAMMASVFLMLGYIALLWYSKISQLEVGTAACGFD